MKVIAILSLVMFVVLSGCGRKIEVSSNWDHEADFAVLKTYQFAERISTEDNDPRIFNDVMIRRIRNALNTGLQERGFKLITSGDPDFKVGWHASIDQEMNMTTMRNDYYYNEGYYGYFPIGSQSKSYVTEWDEGTLVIDVIDPKQNVLIWRGSGTALVEEDVDKDADQRQKDINYAVAKILKDFPPKQ